MENGESHVWYKSSRNIASEESFVFVFKSTVIVASGLSHRNPCCKLVPEFASFEVLANFTINGISDYLANLHINNG